MLFELRLYPADVDLYERYEIKMRGKEICKVLFRIVAVISYYLGIVYSDSGKLLQGVLYGDDIWKVARLFCKCYRLSRLY